MSTTSRSVDPGLRAGAILHMALGACLSLAVSTVLASPPPVFISFDLPGADPATVPFVSGVNEDGVVVGTYYLPGGASVGFIRHRDGRIRAPLSPPGDRGYTVFHGINDEGTISGFFGDAVTTHGFVLEEGSYTTIDLPGAVGGTAVRGINNRGDLVGDAYYSTDPNNPDPGTIVMIPRKGSPVFVAPAPGDVFLTAEAINDRRTIVGWHETADTLTAFVLKGDGIVVDFLFPGAAHSHAWGINDCGIIVGAWGLHGQQHGYYGRLGQLVTYDAPGATATQVHGVSSSGRISGAYFDADGVAHAFTDGPLPGARCED
jgi:hypothetical protein